MSYQALAFFTGLFASLHCVAMCGPLMLSLPFSKQSLWSSVFQKVLYQTGRILVYALLGFAIGLLGTGFNVLGLQQILSLATGAILIAAAIRHFFKARAKSYNGFSKFMQPLISLLGKQLSKPYGGFLAGALNGLLPCGVVYIALAQAINLQTPYEAATFMLIFGAGTTPLLFITALSPVFFRRFKTPAFLMPVLFFIAGSFLVFRGLNLHVPFVSHPVENSTSVPVCD